MGIDLALQGVEASFEQQVLLLFQLDLQAQGIPYLEGNADDNRSAEPDQDAHSPGVGDQGKQLAGIHTGEGFAASLKEGNEQEHEELAIEAGLAKVAPDPAIETEVDKGSEAP